MSDHEVYAKWLGSHGLSPFWRDGGQGLGTLDGCHTVPYLFRVFVHAASCRIMCQDSFIADLVVGLRTGEGRYPFLQEQATIRTLEGGAEDSIGPGPGGQIKTGAPCRSERLAKYNQSKPKKECSFILSWLCGFLKS